MCIRDSSLGILRENFLFGVLIAVLSPVAIFLIEFWFRRGGKVSYVLTEGDTVFEKGRRVLKLLVFFSMIIFFIVAVYFESIHQPLPAGFDRNKHLAYVIWFAQNRNLMRHYMGTTYNNFYPVGMHMVLAILIAIVVSLVPVVNKFVAMSEIFVLMSALIVAMYPLALFLLVDSALRNKSFSKYVVVSAFPLLGYIVVLEPIHMLLGNILVPFTFLICLFAKKSKGIWERIFYMFLLIMVMFVVMLIHTYALVYHVITILAVEFAYRVQMHQKAGVKRMDAFTRRIFVWIKALMGSAIYTFIVMILGLIMAFILYPNYILGIYEESIRISKSSEVLSELARYSKGGVLWSVYNPRDPQFFPLYVYEIVKSVFPIFILMLCLAMILLVFSFVTSDCNKSVLSSRSKTEWRGAFLVFFVLSGMYVFLPIIPKFGITEAKALYFTPISLGLIIGEIQNRLACLSASLRRKHLCMRTLLNSVGRFLSVIVLLFGLVLAFLITNTISFSRVSGYINFAEVQQLAKAISLNVREEYTVVYPDGSRQMELLILETLVRNRIVLASILTDLPQQIEFAKLYKYCYTWKRGAYYLFMFNSSPEEVLRIIVSNHIGAIIANPFYIPNYKIILGLFPDARIVRISSYYTVLILV